MPAIRVVARLQDQDDVDFATVADGEFLQWEAAGGRFVGALPDLSSRVARAGDTMTGALTIDLPAAAEALILPDTPPASATVSPIRLGASAISGGSADGNYIGIRAPTGYLGTFLHFQRDGDANPLLQYRRAFGGMWGLLLRDNVGSWSIDLRPDALVWIGGGYLTETLLTRGSGLPTVNLKQDNVNRLGLDAAPGEPICTLRQHWFRQLGNAADVLDKWAVRIQPDAAKLANYGALALFDLSTDTLPWFSIDNGRRLQFGAPNAAADTNLYRSAADLLKTDDGLFVGRALNGAVVALTDAATIATDASLGNLFTVGIVVDRTLGAPANPTSGQNCVWRIKNTDAVPHTLTLASGAGGFRFGSDITALSAIAAGKTDYFGAIYHAADDRWDVVDYVKGY